MIGTPLIDCSHHFTVLFHYPLFFIAYPYSEIRWATHNPIFIPKIAKLTLTSFIIDNNDPNARGRERFFHYTANPELPKFTLFCKNAWQSFTEESRAEVVNKQRKEFKKTNAYSANYLKQLKNADKTGITYAQYFGQTEEATRAKDDNPFKTLLRGAR